MSIKFHFILSLPFLGLLWDLKSPKIALSRLKSPKVALGRL